MTVAQAPMGAAQPASRAASTPRSARTAACVNGSSTASTARPTTECVSASSVRISRASAPWPGAVGQRSSSRCSVAASMRPMRSRPAAASTTASRSPAVTRERRVSMLPRMSTTSRSGRSARICARRRGDPVPTRAPRGRVASVRPSRAQSTSRGSSRTGTDATVRPAYGAVGRSLSECTTRSHSPRSSDSRSALANTPVPPRLDRDSRDVSPCVVTGTSSTSSPDAPVISAAIARVWARASALPRVPMRSVVVGADVVGPSVTVRARRRRA